MEDGGWMMEDGGWSVERFYDMCRCLIITAAVYFYLRSIFTAGVPGYCFMGRQPPLVYRAKLAPLGGATPRRWGADPP